MDEADLESEFEPQIADMLRAEGEFANEVTGRTTLPHTFEKTADSHTETPAQKFKGGIYDRSLVAEGKITAAPDGEYASLTYGEMRDIVRKLSTGFRALGIERGDRIGIFSDTRMEWAQCDFALLASGAVVTTVYKSSSPQQVQYLLDDPNAAGVIVENEQLLERVLEVIDDLSIQFVITMDDISDEYAQREGIYTLGRVYEEGHKRWDPDAYRNWLGETDLDDLASLVYTSGTTGRPKGVRLTHRNFRTNVTQSYLRMAPRSDRPSDAFAVDETVQTVSYLPLAHVFERMAGHFVPFAVGSCVGYAESVDTLADDFQLLEPNYATSVPRVYERIYDRIREQAQESDFKERVFNWATEISRDYEREVEPGLGLRAKMWLADRLVFSEVKEKLGGNVDILVSGGGTLSKELCTLYNGMGLPIVEGYGMTEAAPVISINAPEEYRIGSIGYQLTDLDLKIDESVVPQEEFEDALGEFGELLVKGENVTDGYWNMPGATEEAFTEDGYFRTGDIVQRRPDGYLVFRERAKQIIVLSTGENVAPAPIEDAFVDSQVVDQCMVMGDDEKFISALIVPNFERLRRAAAEENVDLPEAPAAMCDNERVQEAVAKEVQGVNENFEPREQIKKFQLVPEEWTEDNDLLTPTMKKKRRKIRSRYEHLIEEIYSEGERDSEQAATPAE